MTESTHTTRVAPLPCDVLAAERTLVMGILNVTPDSFSDGGQHYAATDAIARAAIAAGAHIINDVSGLNVSDEMIETAAELQVPYILMHARGTSQTMNSLAEYPRGVVTEVVEELTGLRERFLAAGVLPQNLLAAIDELQGLGHRLLIAGSRKRFIANALTAADMALAERLNASGFTATDAGEAERELWQSLSEPRPAQHRAAASAAVTALVAARGVWAVRVHDVPASVDAVTVASALRSVS